MPAPGAAQIMRSRIFDASLLRAGMARV